MSSTLYDRLGGHDAIVAFADDLLARLQGDAKLRRFWANLGNESNQHQLLSEFLTDKTGGPASYTGKDMKTAHTGMGITEDDWNIFLTHAVASMNKLGIPAAEQGEITAFIGGLKGDIVEAG